VQRGFHVVFSDSFYFAGSVFGYTASNGNMTLESERIWSRAVM